MTQVTTGTPHFAFLVLDEHPYGREMLRQLLDAALVPSIVIEETGALADEEREKFLVRMAGLEVAPTLTDLLRGRDVRREQVPQHNGDACRELVAKSQPNLIVLGGTRILKPHVFENAPDGCLNAHPGLLPEVRGSASVAWSVHRDVPIGCTCHFIDAKIDQGPLVSRREIPVHRGDTYEKLCWLTVGLSGTLMTEAVADWRAGRLVSEPQGEGGETHRNMPDEMVADVRAKLADERYAHYVD
jgi:methionyl-tRNA formyltransferase